MWGVPAAHSFLLLGRLRGVAGPSVMTRPPVRGHPGPLQTGDFMSKAAISTQGRASLGTRTPMSLGMNGTVLVSLKNKIQSIFSKVAATFCLPTHGVCALLACTWNCLPFYVTPSDGWVVALHWVCICVSRVTHQEKAFTNRSWIFLRDPSQSSRLSSRGSTRERSRSF